jgi:hypothetical protein
MTKKNFDNKLEDDDELLVRLLREDVRDSPSEELVERTMTRISAMHAEKKYVYTPLIIPLYLMTAIALLLLALFFVPVVSDGSSLSFPSELVSFPGVAILKYIIWSWLTVVVLWITVLVFQVQWKFKLNPFKR